MCSLSFILLCGIAGYIAGKWHSVVEECERLTAEEHRGKDGGTTYPGPY